MVCAYYVMRNDQHIRNASVVVGDGSVIENARLDWQLFTGDVMISDSTGHQRFAPANSIRYSYTGDSWYLGVWGWVSIVIVAIVCLLSLARPIYFLSVGKSKQ